MNDYLSLEYHRSQQVEHERRAAQFRLAREARQRQKHKWTLNLSALMRPLGLRSSRPAQPDTLPIVEGKCDCPAGSVAF